MLVLTISLRTSTRLLIYVHLWITAKIAVNTGSRGKYVSHVFYSMQNQKKNTLSNSNVYETSQETEFIIKIF